MNPLYLTIISTALVYFFLIALIIIFGKKELSQISVTDLVFILLISNAVQNAMVDGKWSSLFSGIVAAATLFILNFILKQLMFRNEFLSKLIGGVPLDLIIEGKVIRKNLDRQKITMEELEAAVREHGTENIKDVHLAKLEPDGNISVVSEDGYKKTVIKRKRKYPARARQ